MAYESNQGINKLARVLSNRMKAYTESPYIIDFGSILTNGSLVTNTFPKEIPRGEYSVLEHTKYLEPGDRVLVSWIDSEAVVTGVLVK